MAFRLQTLLDLRMAAEKDAEETVAQAVGVRAHVALRQEAHDRAAQEAVLVATAEKARLAQSPPGQGEEGVAHGMYLERLRSLSRARQDDARVHREGPLREATLAETAAQKLHQDARQEREALDKHKAREEATARKIADRRAEDAAGDLALALRQRKKL